MSDFVQVSDKPLSGRERALMQRLFSDPVSLPDEFKRWVADYVSTNGSLHVSGIPTLKGEEWREVGATGQPAYGTNWSAAATHTVTFYRDALGVVHVEGVADKSVAPAAGDVIFTLPEGYRPFLDRHFVIWTGGTPGTFGTIIIEPDGEIKWQSGNADGITVFNVSFRAA